VAPVVVVLAPDEVEDMTLKEWDALRASSRVLFEQPDHPLMVRLRDAGVTAEPLGDDRSIEDGWALVADPGSKRVIELARAGARVLVGPARTPDSLTAAHGAPVARRVATSLAGLAAVMARLRSDDGCPWDRQQTHESLRVHLIEEAHEVIDAIDRGEVGEELEEELGDLLLQVAFHSRLAAQEGRFDFAEVADRIVTKLVHRHPHVFGAVEVADAHEVVRNWEALKAEEKKRSGPFSDIPKSLPSLLAAYKTTKRAAALGFVADEEDAKKRAEDALAATLDADALGEALFWLVVAARARGIDPEGALRRATARFRASL
jgi:tetrapyrrole methylase family protein/MazG family protein